MQGDHKRNGDGLKGGQGLRAMLFRMLRYIYVLRMLHIPPSPPITPQHHPLSIDLTFPGSVRRQAMPMPVPPQPPDTFAPDVNNSLLSAASGPSSHGWVTASDQVYAGALSNSVTLQHWARRIIERSETYGDTVDRFTLHVVQDFQT